MSSGTRDREKALAIESAMKMAYAGKSPADRLHALVDVLCGDTKQRLPLAGVWDTYARWAQASGKRLADVTLRKRRENVRRFVDWAREKWPAAGHVEQVDRACAAAFAEALARDGAITHPRGNREPKGAKGKTRRNIVGDLGTVWEGLRRVRDGIVNVWPLVLPEVTDSEQGLPFDAAQEVAVLRAADAAGSGWGLACRIARHTGLRYGDVAQLAWEAVDMAEGVIRLEPGKTGRHGVTVAVPMCGELLEAMRVQKAKADVSGARQEGVHVLPEHAACYPAPWKGAPGPFAAVLAAAGIEGTRHTFHSWRHTFRTRLAEAGTSDEIARRLGGWTQAATEQRYDHAPRMAEMRAAVEKAAGKKRRQK